MRRILVSTTPPTATKPDDVDSANDDGRASRFESPSGIWSFAERCAELAARRQVGGGCW